jgi:SAM-dependent methyltransferase
MVVSFRARPVLLACCLIVYLGAHAGARQDAPFEPVVGQPGKDVVWVPTPPDLVERMLDLAGVTADDYVMDLGSGDGRNVIAAAKRGARARGVEFNPKMVALSTQTARTEGVSDRATFVEGDMYVADIQEASVLALFLLPSNMEILRPKFLELRPGSRIVSNTFGMEPWAPDETATVGGSCSAWCTALLWIVPAQVAGSWLLPQGELTLRQEYQMVSGTLAGAPIAEGRLRGEAIEFRVGAARYRGQVNGDRMEGTVSGGGPQTTWMATRTR